MMSPSTAPDADRGGFAALLASDATGLERGSFRVQIDGAHATASCYGIAYHYYLPNPSGRNTRVFVGSYDCELVRDDAEWRISHFRLNLKFIDGNPDLEHSAS